MARLGTNLPAGGEVPIELLEELGVSVVRVAARWHVDDSRYFEQLRRRQINIVVACIRESFDEVGAVDPRTGRPTPATQVAAFEAYHQRYGDRVYAWQIGNEPDGRRECSSWPMPCAYLNGLMWRARETLGQDTYLIGPGLVSGDPEWIRGMDLRWIDAIAIHPYGRGTPECPGPRDHDGDIGQLLDRYQAVLDDMQAVGMSKHVTEFGAQSSELGDLGQAEYIGALARWFQLTDKVDDAMQFCVTDWMAPTFGLTRADDAWTRKPAFARYQSSGRRKDLT